MAPETKDDEFQCFLERCFFAAYFFQNGPPSSDYFLGTVTCFHFFTITRNTSWFLGSNSSFEPSLHRSGVEVTVVACRVSLSLLLVYRQFDSAVGQTLFGLWLYLLTKKVLKLPCSTYNLIAFTICTFSPNRLTFVWSYFGESQYLLLQWMSGQLSFYSLLSFSL